jgi:hypothetical protein
MWQVWGRKGVLVVIFEGKRRLGRPKRRWAINIEMYLK